MDLGIPTEEISDLEDFDTDKNVNASILNKHRETWHLYGPVEYNEKNDTKPTDIANATYYLKNVQPLQQKKNWG